VVEAKQRIQLQKTNTQHLLIFSLSNKHFSPLNTSPIQKTQNNVIKLQLHLQPVMQRKPGLGPRQQQQQHRSPAPQLPPWTQFRPSVPISDARRQPGDPAHHPGHNTPLARQDDCPERPLRHERSEHTRCRHQCCTPSPRSCSCSPARTRPRSNPKYAGHHSHKHWLDSRTTW